jgi:hypothetical protein
MEVCLTTSQSPRQTHWYACWYECNAMLIYSFIHSFIHSSFIHSFIHSSFIHSFLSFQYLVVLFPLTCLLINISPVRRSWGKLHPTVLVSTTQPCGPDISRGEINTMAFQRLAQLSKCLLTNGLEFHLPASHLKLIHPYIPFHSIPIALMDLPTVPIRSQPLLTWMQI